jgi:hypothetical protein
MRHIIILSVVISCLSFACDEVPAQPKLVVSDTINWGVVVPDVPPGETAKLHKDVVLKNEGDAILRISEVNPSCGCTSAPLDKDSLLPGESTTMRVSLNLPLSNGMLQKYITVKSNDRDDPVKTLTLKVDVQRPLQLSSAFIPFNRGEVGKPVDGAFTLSSFTDKKIDVKISTTDERTKVLTPAFTIDPKGSAEVKVQYVPQEEGPFQVTVTIETSLEGYRSFTMKGYGAIDPK